MKSRNLLAVLILIGGTAASYHCYTRLTQLVPMSNPEAVTKAEATITAIRTPTIKKGETTSDLKHNVHYRFQAGGKPYDGGYDVRGSDAVPDVGDMEHVVYYTKRPIIHLREAEYIDLPRQLGALRIMMLAFALAAIVLPFGVMNHRG